MDRIEETYYEAFLVYLTSKELPTYEQVPSVPPELTAEQAREIRWMAYENFKKDKSQT